MIDKNSPVPIYYQLEETIKSQIENKQLKPEASLPSERVLAETYEISRMTVRQAINNLVQQGYLYRKKGSGTFVAEEKIEQKLHGLTSFTEDMIARGMEPSSKLIGFDKIPANPSIAKQLRIKEEDSIYEIRRIRFADQLPMAIETNYLPGSIVQGLTKETASHSLYDYIENQLQLTIDHSTQVLESTLATQQTSEVLDIEEGAPVLAIQRNTYLEDGRPLELVQSYYRADRYKFIVQLKRS